MVHTYLRYTLLIIYTLVFFSISPVKGQHYLFYEDFGCKTDSSHKTARLINRLHALGSTDAGGHRPIWFDCEGLHITDTMGRPCAGIYSTIHDSRLKTPIFSGIGMTDSLSGCSGHRFLSVCTPWPVEETNLKDFVVWASDTLSIEEGKDYLFRAFALTTDTSRSKFAPILKLVAYYCNGTTSTVQPSTVYESLPRSINTWQPLDLKWINQYSNAKIQLRIIAYAPDSLAALKERYAFCFGIDNISLEEICPIDVPTHACIGDSTVFSIHTAADIHNDIQSISLYINGVRVTSTPTVSADRGTTQFKYLFSSVASNVPLYYVIKYKDSTVRPADTCGSVINVYGNNLSAGFKYIRNYQQPERHVTFLDTSVGSPSDWQWTFHTDSNTYLVSGREVRATFPATATFVTATLKVSSYCDTSQVTKTIHFCTGLSHVHIDTAKTGTLKYRFTASTYHAGDTNVVYYWYFGDGTSAKTKKDTITHVYSRPEHYTVNLYVSDTACGEDSAQRTFNFCDPYHAFTLAKRIYCFRDSIRPSFNYPYADRMEWYVNGNLVSTDKQPVIFAHDSLTLISVTVYSDCGITTYQDTVRILPKTFANFVYALSDSTLYVNAFYKKNFLGPNQWEALPGTNYQWKITKLGTGAISTATGPDASFALDPGNYTASLTVTANGCSQTITRDICIGKDFHDCCKGCQTQITE